MQRIFSISSITGIATLAFAASVASFMLSPTADAQSKS